MKKFYIPFLLVFLIVTSFSCSSFKNLAGYTLTEKDASAAIRQLLELGVKEGSLTSAFSKEEIMSTVFPEPVRKVLNTVQQLGITPEVERFTTTLSTAAEKTAANSVPVFVSGIQQMKFRDAVQIIKNGNTSATDYLRSTIGDSLRQSIKPVMQTALEEYHLNEQWNNIVKPIAGKKFNLDLANIMAGLVSEAMFRKIAEKEMQVRSDAAARTTPLLQKVFSGNWK